MTEISDDELERWMRAKLFGGPAVESAGFTEEDQLIARKLMGADNARRLTQAKGGQRVRIAPVHVYFEWYEIRGDHRTMSSRRINRVENGRCEEHASYSDHGALEAELFRLRNSGKTIKALDIGFAEKPKTHARKSFTERFGRLGQ